MPTLSIANCLSLIIWMLSHLHFLSSTIQYHFTSTSALGIYKMTTSHGQLLDKNQLVDHCTGILTKVMGANPVQARIFQAFSS